MEKETYIAEVIKEIKNLRKHLTKEQKERLDFESFDPINGFTCIYGQVSGNCFSATAKELIKKCANNKHSFNTIGIPEVNEKTLSNFSPRNTWHNYTFLEHYIATTPQNNEHIINYIKGIDKRLKLK